MEQRLSPRTSIQSWLDKQERKCGSARPDLHNNDALTDFQVQKQGCKSPDSHHHLKAKKKQQLRKGNTSIKPACLGQNICTEIFMHKIETHYAHEAYTFARSTS